MVETLHLSPARVMLGRSLLLLISSTDLRGSVLWHVLLTALSLVKTLRVLALLDALTLGLIRQQRMPLRGERILARMRLRLWEGFRSAVAVLALVHALSLRRFMQMSLVAVLDLLLRQDLR